MSHICRSCAASRGRGRVTLGPRRSLLTAALLCAVLSIALALPLAPTRRSSRNAKRGRRGGERGGSQRPPCASSILSKFPRSKAGERRAGSGCARVRWCQSAARVSVTLIARLPCISGPPCCPPCCSACNQPELSRGSSQPSSDARREARWRSAAKTRRRNAAQRRPLITKTTAKHSGMEQRLQAALHQNSRPKTVCARPTRVPRKQPNTAYHTNTAEVAPFLLCG